MELHESSTMLFNAALLNFVVKFSSQRFAEEKFHEVSFFEICLICEVAH
jgi:hypothetical protein